MTLPSRPLSDRLALLYHLSQTFNSSLDLDEVIGRVLRHGDHPVAHAGAEAIQPDMDRPRDSRVVVGVVAGHDACGRPGEPSAGETDDGRVEQMRM